MSFLLTSLIVAEGYVLPRKASHYSSHCTMKRVICISSSPKTVHSTLISISPHILHVNFLPLPSVGVNIIFKSKCLIFVFTTQTTMEKCVRGQVNLKPTVGRQVIVVVDHCTKDVNDDDDYYYYYYYYYYCYYFTYYMAQQPLNSLTAL